MGFEKKRGYVTSNVTIYEKVITVKGRDIVVIDDIISTGTTIAICVVSLKRQGARDVNVACTHPLLIDGALRRLYDVGSRARSAIDTLNQFYF